MATQLQRAQMNSIKYADCRRKITSLHRIRLEMMTLIDNAGNITNIPIVDSMSCKHAKGANKTRMEAEVVMEETPEQEVTNEKEHITENHTANKTSKQTPNANRATSAQRVSFT